MRASKTLVAVLAGYGVYAGSEKVLSATALIFLRSVDIEQGPPEWLSTVGWWFSLFGYLAAGVVAALVAAERPFVHSVLAGLSIGLVNGFLAYENMAASLRILEEPMNLSELPFVAGLPLLCAGVSGAVIHWIQSTRSQATKPLQSDRASPDR